MYLLETAVPKSTQFKTVQESPFEENGAKSIFNYYSVKNEVEFLKQQINQGVEIEKLQKYTTNNIDLFLEEFVAKEKTKKINYSLKNGRFYYDGVVEPIGVNYTKEADRKGEGTREKAEALGFGKIEQALAKNEANIAYWLSPPSFEVTGFGDYGFLFVFVRDTNSDQVQEYIVRYENEDDRFSKSFGIYSELLSFAKSENNPQLFKNEMDYLSHPLFLKASNPLAYLPKGEAISKLKNHPLIDRWIKDYSEIVIRLAQDDQFSSELLRLAKSKLQAIYNLAGDLVNKIPNKIEREKYIDIDDVKITDSAYIFDNLDPKEIFAFYSSKKAQIIGGGSCPASETNSNHPFSNSPIENIIKNNQGIIDYKTASAITSGTKDKGGESTLECTCPFCHKKVTAVIKDHTITCPKCNKKAPYSC